MHSGKNLIGKYFFSKFRELNVKFSINAYQELNLNTFRAALAAFYLARSKSGKLILTIDDIQEQETYTNYVPETLSQLKGAISWDEGTGNQFGEENQRCKSYNSSERLNRYIEVAEQLVSEGKAFKCFCSKERINELNMSNNNSGYDGTCKKLSASQIQAKIDAGIKYSIRFNTPQEERSQELETSGYVDKIQKNNPIQQKFMNEAVILKNQNQPTKFFMFAVDDIDMEISHVVRQLEWMRDAPKQYLVYKALNASIPQFYHLPNMRSSSNFIFNPSEMYKKFRISQLINTGFSVESLANFAITQIWISKQAKEQIEILKQSEAPKTKDELFKSEIYSSEFLQNHFSIEEVFPESELFDQDKLNYFNKQSIRQQYLPLFQENPNPEISEKLIKDFQARLVIALGDSSIEQIAGMSDKNMVQIIEIVTNRIRYWSDLKGYAFFFTDPAIESESSAKARQSLLSDSSQNQKFIQILKDIINIFNKKLLDSAYTDSQINRQVYHYLENVNKKISKTDLLNILRFALVGFPSSHPFGLISQIIGRQNCLRRFRAALKLLEPNASSSSSSSPSSSQSSPSQPSSFSPSSSSKRIRY